METESPKCRFGRFELRPDLRLLLVDGQPAKLGSRALDVLLALVQRRHRTVGKNELLSIVWPTTVVEENNLQVHISALRKLLGSGAIATVPGRGYQFTADLDLAELVGLHGSQEASRPEDGRGSARRSASYFASTALFGREDDLAALGALLTQHRLITVTGPGGIGKSRLAQQVVHLRHDHFDGGVAWAELGPLTDPTLIGSALAAALDLETRGADLSRELVQALKERKALIVLDNAEHLVEDVARLVQALGQGQSLTKKCSLARKPTFLASGPIHADTSFVLSLPGS